MKNIYLIGILFILVGCDIKLDPNAVDSKVYLSEEKTSTPVYMKAQANMFFDPFNFDHTDFGKLMLLSIDDHPSIKTVELVVQNDGKGAFVVVYYHDGRVESYTNDSLSINKKYLAPNKNWEIVSGQKFRYDFQDTKKGIYFFLKVTTKSGDKIRISLEESRVVDKRYSFLAAVGADLTQVKRFPFIYLKNAGFVPIKGTKVSFKINDKSMELTKIPVTVEGEKCYKIVYSMTPLAFFWNEERDKVVNLKESSDRNSIMAKNVEYTFSESKIHKEVKQIKYRANGHFSTYSFSPAIPDIMSMGYNSSIDGRFCLWVDDIDGIVCGEYSVARGADEIVLGFNPKKCWQPMPGKDWVSAYSYEMKIKILKNKNVKVKSKWVIE